jgi:serine/threonine-protein kinase RsbW
MPTKTFPGRYTSLAGISEFIAKAAKDAGFKSKDIYAVKLAVDEACTNIIEHAYGGESEQQIECSCCSDSEGLTIKLRDWGAAFDPHKVPTPDFNVPLEELESRGAGLFFMRELMDEIKFKFDSSGNLLVMKKKKNK